MKMVEARSPMELPYMRLLGRVLRHVGAWPLPEPGALRPRRALAQPWLKFCLWSTLIVLQILYVKHNSNNLSIFDMGHICFLILVCVVVAQRTTLGAARAYGEVTRLFVSRAHLLHHRHDSHYAMKVYEQVNKICSFVCFLGSVSVVVNPILVSGMPLYHNYRAGAFRAPRPAGLAYELTIYCLLPFDYQHDFIGYISVSIANYLITVEAVLFWYFDLYLSVILFHTWGHLKILDHNLRSFPRPAARARASDRSLSYSREESKTVARLLKEYIDYHRMIVDLVRTTSSAFGLMVFVYYAFHQICDCILLLESFSLDAAAMGEYGVMFVFVVMQMAQMSIVFELINMKSDTLSDAVYSVPWECMRARERRTLLVFLANVQTPIGLKALGVVPVGVRTMAQIIRTSISYFVMLRTLAATK